MLRNGECRGLLARDAPTTWACNATAAMIRAVTVVLNWFEQAASLQKGMLNYFQVWFPMQRSDDEKHKAKSMHATINATYL